MSAALSIGSHAIRRDGEMWCLTDLWRAAGAPNGNRPANWLRKEGAAFVAFLRDSSSVPGGHTRQRPGNPAKGEPPTTWAHWQLALAYAKSLSPEFHARVNEVYRAYSAGQLAPADPMAARWALRIQALQRSEYESVWDIELKLELARLRKLSWTGEGVEPKPLAFAYGRTWRIILGDAVYEELKRRNPHPRDGSLHGQWLRDEARALVKREDLVIALVLARRSTRWSEYDAEMRAHFRRAPIQLRLVRPT